MGDEYIPRVLAVTPDSSRSPHGTNHRNSQSHKTLPLGLPRQPLFMGFYPMRLPWLTASRRKALSHSDHSLEALFVGNKCIVGFCSSKKDEWG